MKIDFIVKNDLVKDIRTFTEYDDVDWDPNLFPDFSSNSFPLEVILRTEFSIMDKFYLRKYFNKIHSNAKSILEIGVNNSGEGSSTYCLLNSKKINTYYFGIDLNDKSYLNSENNNIFTLQENSSNIDDVMKFVRSKGIESFDFIHIDGYHSINQVLDDWRYTEFLSDDGIIVMHDTNFHPGPKYFTEALNLNKFNLEKKCNHLFDYGISFITKK